MDDCKFCNKAGLLWLPLRYSVLTTDRPELIARMPKLSGKLGAGVTDLPLDHGAYAVRILRPGCLYVLIERQGIKYWDAYRVVKGGFLYKFDAHDPHRMTPDFSCHADTCGKSASMVSIPNAQEVQKIWALFTPTTLTKRKLDEYKKNAERYTSEGKLQSFSPARWLAECTQDPLLDPDEVTSTVAEYLLLAEPGDPSHSLLGDALIRQAYPVIPPPVSSVSDLRAAFADSIGHLRSVAEEMKRRQYPGFALYDHIGITQELNNFRNTAFEEIEQFLDESELGIPNLRRLQIYEEIHEVQAGYEHGYVRSTEQRLESTQYQYDLHRQQQTDLAELLRKTGRNDQAKVIENEMQRHRAVREGNFKKMRDESPNEAKAQWAEKYASRLNQAEMEAFYNRVEAHTKNAVPIAEARSKQHLVWFESNRLVKAFDVFDETNRKSGYDFALETALCSFGMNGSMEGEDNLDKWIQQPEVDRKNLYMRGFYYNMDDVIAHANEVNAQMRREGGSVSHVSHLSPELLTKVTKDLVNDFKKIDSAFDEWMRDRGSESPIAKAWLGNRRSLELILYHKVSDITRMVIRSALGGKLDKRIVASTAAILFSRQGALTAKFAFDELLKEVAERDPATLKRVGAAIAQSLKEYLNELVEDAQKKAGEHLPSLQALKARSPDGHGFKLKDKELPVNNYHQTRFGVILACLELIGMAERLPEYKSNSEWWLPTVASGISVTSLVLDTFYSAVKSIPEMPPDMLKPPDTKKWGLKAGTNVVRGGLKLSLGVLSFGSTMIGAWIDFGKISTTKDNFLQRLYVIRAANGFISGGLTTITALSYSEELLKNFARGYARHQAQLLGSEQAAQSAAKWLTKWAERGSWLAKSRLRLLVWAARLNALGLILTGIEIGYMLLKDDDLQKWLSHCTFGLHDAYKNVTVTTPPVNVPVRPPSPAANAPAVTMWTVAVPYFSTVEEEIAELENALHELGIERANAGELTPKLPQQALR